MTQKRFNLPNLVEAKAYASWPLARLNLHAPVVEEIESLAQVELEPLAVALDEPLSLAEVEPLVVVEARAVAFLALAEVEPLVVVEVRAVAFLEH
jgi:hypothetical protein